MTEELFEVRLLELPLRLRERSRQQGADLLREIALVRSGPPGGATSRFLALAEDLDTVYRPYLSTSELEMDAALDRGEDVVPEVVHRVPQSAVAFVVHARAVLAEVSQYCRSDGHLLTLEPDDDIAAYREWCIEEVQRQHRGLLPTPWPRYEADRGVPS